MASKRFFFASFLIFFFLKAVVHADHGICYPPKVYTDTCHLPAPTDFRVLGSGPTFTTLAWEPSVSGAAHTIQVLKQPVGSSAWVPVNTIKHVTGNQIMVTNLQPDTTYGYSIATECTDGSPSDILEFFSPTHGVILELVLDGRVPKAATDFGDCTHLSLTNDWVGFKITGAQGSSYTQSDYFEYTREQDHHNIKRVKTVPSIVGHLEGDYPQIPSPLVVTNHENSTFEVKQITSLREIPIGYLTANYDEATNEVWICKTPNLFWNSNYVIQMVTAEGAQIQSNQPENRSARHNQTQPCGDIQVSNPITDNLFVNLLGFDSNQSGTIELLTTEGSLISKINIEDQNIFCLPTVNLPVGLYLLVFKTPCCFKIFKILKT